MSRDFDVIVLGVGGMGSSACYHLAKRGIKVLGLEQFSLAHDLGSSHGKVRLIRKAYFEHSDYVPLLNRAYELWDDLAKNPGAPLFHRTGVLIIGSKDKSEVLPGIRQSAKAYKIPVED